MQTVIQYEAGRQVDALENIKNAIKPVRKQISST